MVGKRRGRLGYADSSVGVCNRWGYSHLAKWPPSHRNASFESCWPGSAGRVPDQKDALRCQRAGSMQGLYEFDSERDFVKRSFKEKTWKELVNPTAAQLGDAISSFKPDIVHLAGFDTHLARSLLLDSGDDEAAALLEDELAKRRGSDEIGDGYILSGRTGLDPVGAEKLGAILSTGGHHPQLVSLNIGNSAARIAPLVVAHGASAAIGFQGQFQRRACRAFLLGALLKACSIRGETARCVPVCVGKSPLPTGKSAGYGGRSLERGLGVSSGLGKEDSKVGYAEENARGAARKRGADLRRCRGGQGR